MGMQLSLEPLLSVELSGSAVGVVAVSVGVRAAVRVPVIEGGARVHVIELGHLGLGLGGGRGGVLGGGQAQGGGLLGIIGALDGLGDVRGDEGRSSRSTSAGWPARCRGPGYRVPQ